MSRHRSSRLPFRRTSSCPALFSLAQLKPPEEETEETVDDDVEDDDVAKSPLNPFEDVPELAKSCPAFLKLPLADSAALAAEVEATPEPVVAAEVPPVAKPNRRSKAPARVSFCHDPYGWGDPDVDSGPASCPPTPSCGDRAIQQCVRSNVERGIHGGALLAFHISQALAKQDTARPSAATGEEEAPRGAHGRNSMSSALGSEELSEWDDTHSCSTETSRPASSTDRDAPPLRIAPCVLPLVPELIDRRAAFLLHPIPETCGTIQCMIQRDRRLMGSRYVLSLEIPPHPLLVVDEYGREFVDSNVERATSIFLCAARKSRAGFVLSADKDDFEKRSKGYLGKCRKASALEYSCVVRDRTPTMVDPAQVPEKREVLALTFTEASKTVPSKVSATLQPDKAEPGAVDPECLLQSSAPLWNARRKAYELDLGPRVRCPSSKNLQLEDASEGRRAIRLTFGKADENSFILDFAYPFSVVQAFSVALACFNTL